MRRNPWQGEDVEITPLHWIESKSGITIENNCNSEGQPPVLMEQQIRLKRGSYNITPSEIKLDLLPPEMAIENEASPNI